MEPAKFIRKKVLGLTQTELAEKLKVTQASVSRWEKKGRFPTDRMDNIRELGKKQPGGWSDSWFFEVPPQPDQKGRAA